MINFIYKFFTIVVFNCITPENFVGCVQINQWLIPDIQHYAPYLWGERQAYDTEKDINN